ncbi:MAG: DUF5007 domain-containing protein [Bacteroides sp.]|nr:DUF5007 domain-containing protein [Bacteroides sp.]
MKNKRIWYAGIPGCLVGISFVGQACVSDFLPDSLDAFDKDATFSTTVFEPVLGRNTVLSEVFNPGNSTLPLTFTITRIEAADGSEAPELTDVFPVRVWNTPYLGTETTLEEIEKKRSYEYRTLFEVREHSGDFVMWANALSSFVKCAPAEGYVFDVKAENSGGYQVYTDLQLIPTREMDYEPNTTDEETGFITDDYVTPTSVTNLYAEGSSSSFNLLEEEDVQIYFRRDYDNTDTEYTLTFRFMEADYTPINPSRFSNTDWNTLVHGFDMEMTDEYVRYKVAYPIPLSNMVTDYTNEDGDMASVKFSYDRLFYNSTRITASINFEFAIYTEGHWEIVFVFAGGSPDFSNIE